MDVRPSSSDAITTAPRVARQLGFGDAQAAWLAKLACASPSTRLREPDPHALSELLGRLDVTPEDAAEVLRTMPSPHYNPELWWLLERRHHLLTHNLVSRANDPPEPPPPLPPDLKLFPVHLILVSIDAIRRRHRELGIPTTSRGKPSARFTR